MNLISRSLLKFVFAMLLIQSFKAVAQDDPGITLSEGLKIVTEDSRIVKIAKFSELLAETNTKIARSDLLPNIRAGLFYTDLSHQPAMKFGTQIVPASDAEFYSYSIEVEQILFDFRGSLSKYEASKMILEAQKFDTVKTSNDIAIEFTNSFYDLLESIHLMDLAAKETERLTAHNSDTKNLFEAGVITINDLLQVQVRLSDARRRYLTTKNLVDIRSSNLNNLLLRPLKKNIKPLEPEVNIIPPSISYENACDVALSMRPEILILDHTLNALDLEEVVKRSESLPKFFLSGTKEYKENSYQVHEDNWIISLGVKVNLFDGGRSFSDLQKTKISKRQLIEQREKLVDEIKLQLQSYILSLDNAYASILVNRDAIVQGEENLRINKKRYEEGEGTATEVLDAVTDLSISETNQIQSVYNYLRAEAAVHYAMGKNLSNIYKQ